MSVQDSLQVAGVISLFVAMALALLTAYSFVSQDIPSVLDDLSGRRRQRDMGRASARVTHGEATLLPLPDARPNPALEVPSEGNERDARAAETQSTSCQPSAPADSAFNVVLDIVLCPVTELALVRRGLL